MRQWEVPGGGIDPDEAPLQAAVRELREESGLRLPGVALAGYARFRLAAPAREEYAAVRTGRTGTLHRDFAANREIGAIHWWDTAGPPPRGTQIIDATTASIVCVRPSGPSRRR